MSCTPAIVSAFLFVNSIFRNIHVDSTSHPHSSVVRRNILSPEIDYKIYFYEQQIDHFSFVNNNVFKQRFLVADQFWKPGGPIFFYTGNEGDITWFCNNTGLMWEIAPLFHAKLVFAEHRYYGKSVPFEVLPKNDSTKMGYLTTEQALADFAVLIKTLKNNDKNLHTAKVIAFGGSYGGMLAAWFRMKYPNIVDGALAASAPIWNFIGQVSCDAFAKVNTETFRKSSEMCVKNIKNSWKTLTKIAQSDLKFISSTFKLCKPLSLKTDVDSLKTWLTSVYSSLAMVDYPYPSNFLEPLPGNPVKAFCQPLSMSALQDKELIQALSDASQIYYNYTGKSPCLNISQEADPNLGVDMWNYQACTEMVMPFCTSGTSDMFEPSPFNYTQFIDNCYAQYNVKPRPHWASLEFLGKNITSTSKIVFSNGLLDPWSSGGVVTLVSPSLPVIIIPNGAHHVDLRFSNPQDTSDITEARKQEVKFIQKWIQ